MKRVSELLDRAFAPDLVVVLGANSVVLSCDAVSEPGRRWLAGRCVAGLNYDLAFRKANDLTIESTEAAR